MNDFGIYVIITEPVLPYRQIAEICVAEEIKVIQLREKKLSDRKILETGKILAEITKGSATRLIINDRPDLASLIGADGYHLGQDDLPLQEAYKFYPEAPIKGLSTHSLQQAEDAVKNDSTAEQIKPDYIGFGPVFSTPTKEIPDPVVGTEKLKQVLSFVRIPVVAIGGIDDGNIVEVLEAGAKNFALVRFFMKHKDLKSRIRAIKDICKDLCD